MTYFITVLGCIVGVLLIVFALLFQGFYVADKRKVCSNATVEYSDGKGSVVHCLGLVESTLYYIEKSLKVGTEIKILDFQRIEEIGPKENFYLKLHRCKISRLSKKSYHLAEGVYRSNIGMAEAVVKRVLDKQPENRLKCLCSDVETGKPVVVNQIPNTVVTKPNAAVRYDKLQLTPSIRVTKVISD